MRTTIYLRIASVMTLIHAVLHTIGGVFGKPMPGTAAMVASTMQSNRFPVFGVMRTYSDFYMGMGLGATITMTVETVVFWMLASLAITDSDKLRPILAAFMIQYLALAVNSYHFFFLGPVIAELLIAACFGMAILTAKPADLPIAAGARA
jgi:hypothetical protein